MAFNICNTTCTSHSSDLNKTFLKLRVYGDHFGPVFIGTSGIRGGVRGGVRSGIRGGVRSGEGGVRSGESGVRGGVRSGEGRVRGELGVRLGAELGVGRS